MKKSLYGATALALLELCGTAKANILYFAQPVNYDQAEIDTLFLYGASGTTGSVTSPSGFNSNFSVGSNNVTSVVIPSSYDLTASGVVTGNGFTISASGNVGASYLSREPFTTDTTYLFDSTALGTSYYAVGATNSIGYPSQLSIVGTQNGTTVTITPATALAGGHPANVPFTVALNAGQAVLYTDAGGTGSDVTGTRIVSSAPIAVFGGNQCVDIPSNSTACDHTITALPSTDHYTTHAVVPTTTGTEGASSNILRILAATDGTVVTYNGAVAATLGAGQFADIRTGPGGELTSNNPVLLNEYLTGQSEHPGVLGDPAQSYIPGVDQELSNYVFSTPVGSQAYTNNFLNISIATADIASLMLNGVAVPASDCVALAGTQYSTCQIAIDPGAGTILANNPFLLLVDGGTTNDSYLTFAGTTFSTGASPSPTPTPTPVPEPASLMLLTAGVATTWVARRRDMKRA